MKRNSVRADIRDISERIWVSVARQREGTGRGGAGIYVIPEFRGFDWVKDTGVACVDLVKQNKD
jgi:hypothetical protein